MSHTIEYRIGDIPDRHALSGLYKSVEWAHADAPEALHKAISQSGWVATAWHDDMLVGLARVLTDGVYVAYFQELLVHPDYQHQGVGKELLDHYDQMFGEFQDQVAVTDADWAKHKLNKRGFQPEPAALSRIRPFSTRESSQD
jgi:GNAT superfamily N-acetyltransferase